MVVVTHEISFARDVASRIIFMDGGTVAQEGTPKQLLEESPSPRLAEFLGQVVR